MVAFTSVEETSIRKQATNSKFEYLVQHVPHYKQIKAKTQGVHQQGSIHGNTRRLLKRANSLLCNMEEEGFLTHIVFTFIHYTLNTRTKELVFG